jgi:hypothetical protein
VDGKKTYTNDIEVTDQVIFKDGPTTRGSITGVIGSANPAKLFFETNDAAGVAVNSMFLDANGLTVSLGNLTIPSNITAGGKITAAGDVQGVRGIFSSNIDINKTIFVRDPVMRGYIDWATGAGVGAAMTIEIDNDAAVMVNRMAMNSTGFYLANGHITAESGGAILRGGTGVLLTSSGASPQIRGSLISDVGSASGTTAVRSYNSSGVVDGLIYVNSGEAATDRAGFTIYNASDKGLWFRNGSGVVQGAIFNYTSGRIDMRCYSGGAVKNYIGIDEIVSGYSSAPVWTFNSVGSTADTWISHRVNSSRAMRWYYAQSGDIFLQESDDNYGSHFINVFSFTRGNHAVGFPHDVLSGGGGYVTQTFGKGIHFPSAGSQASLTGNNYDGVGTGPSPKNNVELASWWGFGFRCLTDSNVRWAVDTRTGATYQSGDLNIAAAAIFQDGNMKFAGTMVGTFGQYLSDALGQRGVVYTGGGQDDTVFPISHQVLGQTGDGIVLIRNSAQLLYLSSNYSYSYTGTTGCGGSWRMRGGYDSPGSGAWSYSWERVA